MPIYVYQGKGCKKCKNRFEAFQSMFDEPLSICPDCQKEIYRVITSVNIMGGEFRSFRDTANGEVVWNRDQLKQREKAGQVFCTHEEAAAQMKKNKAENIRKQKEGERKRFKERMEPVLRKQGLI